MPSNPYSTPACAVNTIVPLCTAQVGCVTLAVVGTAGADGIALIASNAMMALSTDILRLTL